MILSAWTDRQVDTTVSPSPLYGFDALRVRPWPPTPNVFLVKCIVSPLGILYIIVVADNIMPYFAAIWAQDTDSVFSNERT